MRPTITPSRDAVKLIPAHFRLTLSGACSTGINILPAIGGAPCYMHAMQHIPAELVASFERRLDQARVPQTQRRDYHQWVELYLAFAQTSGYPAPAPTALGPFLTKLAATGHSIDQRHHAAAAVRLLIRPEGLGAGGLSPGHLRVPQIL